MPTDAPTVPVLLSGDRSARVALVVPEGEPPAGGWPAVLVLHEVFGLTPEMTHVARMFADRGWVAVVPDLFSAGTRIGCLVRSMREVVQGRPGPVTDDVLAVHRWLRDRDDVDADRTAAIGFCMGGSFALLLGSLGPDGLRAVSDNYGRPAAATTDLTRCPPLVGSFGALDRFLPGAGPALADRLTAAGVVNDVRTYEGAGHAFMAGSDKLFGVVPLPPGIGYAPAAAADAWATVFAFLERHTAPR